MHKPVTFTIDAPYLYLPVKPDEPTYDLHLFIDGQKIDEISLNLAAQQPAFYVAYDLRQYQGKTLKVVSYDEKDLSGLKLAAARPQYCKKINYHFHFQPEVGWLNDPCGLFFKDGCYHLYYQYNPYGCSWGNMHWGHATSKDLLHFQTEELFLKPDEFGPAFTGSALIKDDDIYFFYTAAGSKNEWSRVEHHLCAQRLVISRDNGYSHTVSKEVLPHIEWLNRDPFVFYHAESAAYIMALFIDINTFALFRSKDLYHWQKTQSFEIPGAAECPNLFKLNDRWIFLTCRGHYLVGDFDGYCFKSDGVLKNCYAMQNLQSLQLYANLDQRVVGQCFIRQKQPNDQCANLMGFPIEFSFINDLLILKPALLFTRQQTLVAKESIISKAGQYQFKSAATLAFYQGDKHLFSIEGDCIIIVDEDILEYFQDKEAGYGAYQLEEGALSVVSTCEFSMDICWEV